jgi:hypothetical protein
MASVKDVGADRAGEGTGARLPNRDVSANRAVSGTGPLSESRGRPWARLLGLEPSVVPSEKVLSMGDRMTWPEICHATAYQGRWVALDHCRYDQTTMQPIEGDVVDSDDDLGSLCSRMREAGMSSCAIRFCDSDEAVEVPASRVNGSEYRAVAR